MTASAHQDASLKPLSGGTINVIRHRCERDIRSDLLRWSGLPIGGTGALAFLATLLTWIPQQIQNADLGEFGHDIVRSYVEATVIHHAEFQERLDGVIRAAVKESAAKEIAVQIQTLSGARVEQTLTATIQGAVADDVAQALRTPAMEAPVNAAVADVLQRNNYQPLREAIVASTKTRLSETVVENAGKAIQTVANPLPEDQMIDKSTYSRLTEYVRDLASRPLPEGDFALRKYLAAGTDQDHRYDHSVIATYLRDLRAVLGNKFRYVLILDRQHRFVALSTVDEFARVVEASGYRLEDILNNGSLTLEQASQELGQLLGPDSLLAMDESMTIKAALQSQALQGRKHQVAVVEDAQGARRFKGVTDRGRLIEALLP